MSEFNFSWRDHHSMHSFIRLVSIFLVFKGIWITYLCGSIMLFWIVQNYVFLECNKIPMLNNITNILSIIMQPLVMDILIIKYLWEV